MAQEQTVTIRYLVFCGKHTPDGSMRSFNYREQAPASLCVPHVDDGPRPDADATGLFISSIVNRHNDEILLSQAWRCVTCDKPATEILHSAVPLLSPVADRATADFEPTVMDNAAPICMSGGACDRAAEKTVHEFAKSALIQKPWQTWDMSKTCDRCAKKSGVKLCSGCKLIA
jgi:hypothetical protein